MIPSRYRGIEKKIDIKVIDDIKADIYHKYGDTGWVDDHVDNIIDIIDKHIKRNEYESKYTRNRI